MSRALDARVTLWSQLRQGLEEVEATMDARVLELIAEELGRQSAQLVLIGCALDALAANLDHVHDDLVALRVVARVPRDACYPERHQEEKRG